MPSITLENAIRILIYCTIPGAAGGLVVYLYGLRKGHYKNNKLKIKFLIEFIGSMTTATFFYSLYIDTKFCSLCSFVVGVGWAGIIHVIRDRITTAIKSIIKDVIKDVADDKDNSKKDGK